MPKTLPASTKLGPVTLAVADLERSLSFYRDLAGLRVLSRDASSVALGAGTNEVLHLVEEPGAKRAPHGSTGLYHTAILYPDRAALARVVQHIASRHYPFTGASDHRVSEAFYLNDPDGLGVELYRDRARAEWKWSGKTVEMATLPLDVQGLLADADRPFDGAPEGTRVGHVHLRVERHRGSRVVLSSVCLASTSRRGSVTARRSSRQADTIITSAQTCGRAGEARRRPRAIRGCERS